MAQRELLPSSFCTGSDIAKGLSHPQFLIHKGPQGWWMLEETLMSL